jgi:phosphoribosyl 1,2-cyclic phosphodiesterase
VQFCCLGSGSKGNATLVRFQEQLVMVDCGFSLKYIAQAMSDKACSPNQLTAILVTHEHADHIQGVNTLAKRLCVPVYCTAGTFRSGKINPQLDVRIIQDSQAFQLGNLQATAVTVPHDANEPCQFHFQANAKKLGILTDLGSISEHVFSAFADCHALLLEANHDKAMLMAGPYPPSLKHRVASDWGHLSNDQAAQFLHNGFSAEQRMQNLSTLVLGHISEKNNSLHSVKQLFGDFEKRVSQVLYASQQTGFSWLSV